MPQTPLALHRLEAVDAASGRVNAVIDTPQGSRAKYKYDEKTGLLRLSKLLPLGACFPFNFGFVPSTRADDGDALDILVLMEEAVFAGCVVPVRLIGALAAKQTEKNGKTVRNDRLIGIVDTDFNPPAIRSLEAVPAQQLEEIEQFFVFYNHLEGRRFRPTGRYGPDKAEALVKQHGITAEAS